MASLNRIMFSAMPRNEKQKMKIQVHCTLMTFPAIRFLCSTFFIFVRFKPNKNDFFSLVALISLDASYSAVAEICKFSYEMIENLQDSE